MPKQSNVFTYPKLYRVASSITEPMKKALDRRLRHGTYATIADYIRAVIEEDLRTQGLL